MKKNKNKKNQGLYFFNCFDYFSSLGQASNLRFVVFFLTFLNYFN